MEKVKQHWLKIILLRGYVFLLHVGIEAAAWSFSRKWFLLKHAGYSSIFCFWVTKLDNRKLWEVKLKEKGPKHFDCQRGMQEVLIIGDLLEISVILSMKFKKRNSFIWVKVFKNGPSKTCGRQPLKNLNWYGHFKFFKGCLPQILLGPFLSYFYGWAPQCLRGFKEKK